MQFKDIAGQEELKSSLVRMVKDGNVAHAMILAGESGRGSLALAIALASYILCEDRGENDSCGKCRACVKTGKLAHPDLHFSFPVSTSGGDRKGTSSAFLEKWRSSFLENPYMTESSFYREAGLEGKSGMIGVAEAQSIIRSMMFKPYESEYRIMVIWLPERMNQEAANKLLKLIEEPPAKSLFFLVADSTERILPTIMSRCRYIDVPPVEVKALAEFAESRLGVDPEKAMSAAKASNGSVSALMETAGEDGNRFSSVLDNVLESAFAGNLVSLLETADELAGTGREAQKSFCMYASSRLEKIFMLSAGISPDSGEDTRYPAVLGPQGCMDMLSALDKAVRYLESNVNPRLVFSDLFNRFYVAFRRRQ